MKSPVLRGWIRGLSHIQSRRFAADQEGSMEQFVHQQTIAIFRRLLSTQTDNDEVRRQRLLKLLADEEAKNILSSQHDVSPGPAFAPLR